MSWGKTLIDQLILQGVDYFCIGPGFRTTPLVLSLSDDPRAKCFIHFDERGLAFHALGYAKATGKPAAVLVTSGTAVGNLMPAVMEASSSHTPMILLTCDRPAELRDTMANQTCDQLKLFGNYVRYFFDFPSPNTSLPLEFLATTIAQGISKATGHTKGPVHFNFPFPEPFFQGELVSLAPPKYSPPLSTCDGEMWAKAFSHIEKGVIVIGADGGSLDAKSLSQKLGWPILTDIISSYRHYADEQTIRYAHHLLQIEPQLSADVVVHLGGQIVSKVLQQWIKKQRRVIQISPHSDRCDPLHCVTDRVICSPSLFCKEVADHLPPKLSPWITHWQTLSKSLSFPPIKEELTEPSLIKIIEKVATPHTALFFGNSMPVRDADQFFYPERPTGPIFANRGLSGIDGNLATCAGIAQTMPVIALIGDQTFLHDLNSLTQFNRTVHPIKLIVINNGGGGIFSFVAKDVPKKTLDTYFAAQHDTQFEKAAQLFGIQYYNAKTPAKLQEWLTNEESCLIEVFTNREENLLLHKQIDKQMKESLCSSSSTAF